MGKKLTSSVKEPWAFSWEEIADQMGVSAEKGLGQSEARKRLNRYGLNRLRTATIKSPWVILWDQIRNPIMALLVLAAVLSFSFGRLLEGVSIVVAIVINGAIGFFTELRATRSMEALQRMSRVRAKVLREGNLKEIPSDNLVPGDMVILEAGDMVPADLRLTESSRLQADESSLTGESVAVDKEVDPLDGNATLAERKNMLFKGTAVTMGSGRGVVVATGMETELGKVASLAEEAEEELTPLEKRLNGMAYRLVWITLGIALIMAVIGVIARREILLIIETSIALAVAAIPEGLPIVATIALARGMWRMARRNAMMNRLSAVETLGATNIICTDKTGTLTENRMTLSQIHLPSEDSQGIEKIEVGETRSDNGPFLSKGKSVYPSHHPILKEVLEVGVLCNNAELKEDDSAEKGEGVGDPLEIALLRAGTLADMTRHGLLEAMPEEREEAFDPAFMMMATYHRVDGDYRIAVKGAMR